MIINRRTLLAGAAASTILPAPAIWAQGKPTVFAIQYGLPYLNFIVAERLGLFEKAAKEAGLRDPKISTVRLSGPTAITEGLISGNVDVGALGTLGLLIAHEKTRRIYDMGGLSAYWKGVYTIYANDPAIKSLKDIRPTDKIAMPGPSSSQAMILRRAAEKLFGPGQASRFDKQIVSLPHPDAVAALSSGNTVQVYFALSPFTEFLAQNPKLHVIGTTTEFNPPNMTNGVVGVMKKFVDQNAAFSAAIVKALDEAGRFIIADVPETAKLYRAAEPSKLDDATMLKVIENNKNEYTTQPNGVIDTARFMVKLGQLKEAPARWQDVFFPPVNQGAGS
jgi:NitT/TauT family transport system substrate-binding protein